MYDEEMMDLTTARKFLKEKGLENYKPHLSFQVEKGPYIIKLAETEEELIKTFSLRYEVYGQYYKTQPPVPLDIDAYDQKADHIIIINKDEDTVVGTYRVLCSDFTDDFYTAREFDISAVTSLNQKFVEMGRATVSEKARSGAVITLLWRGLGEYITESEADYLFGCATLWTQDFGEVADVWKYFDEKALFFDKEVYPLGESIIPEWANLVSNRKETDFDEEKIKQISKSLPPLFKSYIKAGAKFGANPANDAKLQSVDFFTICKVSELADGLVKKYL